MTQLYNGNYVLRPFRTELMTEATLTEEVDAISARIEDETGISVSHMERPDGIEVHARQRSSIGERIVENQRINREDRSECYLDLDPMGSNCP